MTAETDQLRVAFATNDNITVDGHFGSCGQFNIYSIDTDNYQKIDVRITDDEQEEDKNNARAELIRDCHLLFCASIGGPAAARVISFDIHPMKCKPVNDVFPEITEQMDLLLQRMQSNSLPPWLAKLTGQTNQLNTRFESLD